MSPECLYWVALFALVLPSVPFNRTGLVVLAVWAFGYFSHVMGSFENAAIMFAAIIAFGAALGISKPWDGSRRAYANVFVAILFIPNALLSAYNAIYVTAPPADWHDYYVQTSIYWATWGVIMVQALLVPVGNDWERVRSTLRRVDDWLMAQIVKRFAS